MQQVEAVKCIPLISIEKSSSDGAEQILMRPEREKSGELMERQWSGGQTEREKRFLEAANGRSQIFVRALSRPADN